MNLILGLAIVLASCAIGFLLSGGHLIALFQPFELLILLGSAFGSMMVANPMSVTIGALKSIGGLTKGSVYKKDLYLDVLALLYDLFNKMRREGMLAVESDIDDPIASPLFS